MLNREVFLNDPVTAHLPNDGVAKVVEPQDDQAWLAAEFELRTFVCEGAYHEGLSRILTSFLSAIDKPTQPAVWVSGFYGSGKSHLVRVLEFLWRDMKFPSGASARGIANLPADIKEKLQELTTVGRQQGGLWSAAGTPISGSGLSVRLAILGVMLRSAGLPDDFGQAQFVVWLKEKGWYDDVAAAVASEHEDFESELLELSLSTPIARALLAKDPGLGSNEAAVLDSLKRQFPVTSDISESQMISAVESILRLKSTRAGRTPCTLIVLDELQQYAGSDIDRIAQLGVLVERCSTQFQGRLLFVGTGQSALEGSPHLSRLQDRFTVKVQLSDTDVESVVRKVVLTKKPSSEPEVKKMIDRCAGEIDRQLAGTKLGTRSGDREFLTADYPLLPVRRRFWERVLRTLDTGGSAQLRTQLRMALYAVKHVAERPVGNVVAADFLFNQQLPFMQQSGILLQDTHTTIAKLAQESGDGPLLSRLCALIFLINRLNREGGEDIGVRAEPDVLADLLVEDLGAGSSDLRRRIPDMLARLVADGVLMNNGSEYLLQTREGQEWEKDRRLRSQRILADTARIATLRQETIKGAVASKLDRLGFTQGVAKVPRKVDLYFSDDAPKADSGTVPVWIRSEWSVSDTTVKDDARDAGLDSPIVFVFLPKAVGDSLDRALADREGAAETIAVRGEPITDEGREAKCSMESHQSGAADRIGAAIGKVVSDARIYQGGGSPIDEGDLRSSVDSAARSAAVRLFPRFADADQLGWDKVLRRAKDGSEDALSNVGHQGDPSAQPVVRQLLQFLGAPGAKAAEVRRKFTAPPYGWPQDAIDGALLAGLSANLLLALKNGAEVSASSIEQSGLGQIEFRCQSITVTGAQRIAVRTLLKHCDVTYKEQEEAAALPELLRKLIELAEACGGPAPMPPAPNTEELTSMRSLSGNNLVAEAYKMRESLKNDFDQWSALGREARLRLVAWSKLESMLRHMHSLDCFKELSGERDAIKTNRSLLAEPDPIAPLAGRLADTLRDALQQARERHLDTFTSQIDSLEKDQTWNRLTDPQKAGIRAAYGLGALPPLRIGTDDELIASLDSVPLSEWESRTAALSERISRALHDAVKLLEPAAVRVRLEPMTFKTADEVRAYLAEIEKRILAEIEAGHPVVVGA